MHYTEVLNRPPYEAQSILLQVTSGCSHNKCKFCNFYKDIQFKVSPLHEIEEDLEEARIMYPHADRVFFQSADGFVLSYDKLKAIGLKIREKLPNVKSIGSYARVTNMKNKTIEQLKELKEIGYDLIFVGIESGDDDLLDRMNKGYHAKDIIEQCRKLEEAGITYIAQFINGLGGKEYGMKHVISTANVFNQLKPIVVGFSQLTLFPKTELYQEYINGTFQETGEKERIMELMTMIKNLNITVPFVGNHVSIATPVAGYLPQDKEKLLKTLGDAYDNIPEEDLVEFRKNVRSL